MTKGGNLELWRLRFGSGGGGAGGRSETETEMLRSTSAAAFALRPRGRGMRAACCTGPCVEALVLDGLALGVRVWLPACSDRREDVVRLHCAGYPGCFDCFAVSVWDRASRKWRRISTIPAQRGSAQGSRIQGRRPSRSWKVLGAGCPFALRITVQVSSNSSSSSSTR